MIATPRANFPNLAVNKALMAHINIYVCVCIPIFRVRREAEWKKFMHQGILVIL